MKDSNLQNNNENTPVNDNDNASLNDNICLEAIPYEQALQQNGWGKIKPITAALLPVEPFSLLQLPMPLMDYIYEVADLQQSSLDFIAISALCGLAAVIGNGVRIAPKKHDNNWKIVPNLWGALVGQPSTLKTPTMQAALTPLYAFQEEWHKEWLKKKEQQETKDILSELDKREKKKQAYKALKDQDEEQAFALLSQSIEHKESDDDTLDKRRLIVNDVTVEKLGKLLK